MSEATRARDTTGLQDGLEGRWAAEWARMWELAVRRQMHRAGQRRHEANESVAAIIAQLIFLSTYSSWFEDHDLRVVAVEEVLGYLVLGTDVSSRLAQQVWLRGYAQGGQARSGPPPSYARDGLGQDALIHRPIEREALDAWDTWARALGWTDESP